MNLSPASHAPLRPARRLALVRTIAVVLAISSGLLTLLLSQASSPDYRQLFWRLLPLAILHLGSALVCFRLSTFRWRLTVALSSLIVLGSFAEMTLRVWL